MNEHKKEIGVGLCVFIALIAFLGGSAFYALLWLIAAGLFWELAEKHEYNAKDIDEIENFVNRRYDERD